MSGTAMRGRPAILRARKGGPEVWLNPRTGLPSAISAGPDAPPVELDCAIELETDGEEIPGVMGGLEYRDTRRHEVRELVPGSVEQFTSGDEETYVLDSEATGWRVRLRITFRPDCPRIALWLAASPTRPGEEGPGEEALLRDLRLTATLHTESPRQWLLEAPGNKLRPGVRVSELDEPVSVQTAGHELGSPGIVALHRSDRPLTFVIWPLSRSEQGQITVEARERGVGVQLRTQLGGAVEPSEWLEHGPIYMDMVQQPWNEVRREIKQWYPSVGIFTPRNRPGWASAVSIFEVMVGPAPFYDGFVYCPYPTMSDLIDDLDRIAGLGFSCLQLMPRHPYPSYNIHEPGDVSVTYGAPGEVKELVAECHRRGIRLIFDILLHGVVDREVMERAIALVGSGPHVDRLDEPCADPYAHESVEISWCRHILAFAPDWLKGAPAHHPLLDDHPEWFMRDSHGSITGVYTHALDIANDAWQERFIDGCEAIVREYGIDGFRLDAPLYNRFPNWSEATRRHASYSSMGALRLFARLRRRLHAVSNEIILHTEPSGPFARESIDLNYGYEEMWLIGSMFDPRDHHARGWRRVTTGKQLAAWFADFDSALPDGSVSAHFVDCHDSIWWRLRGDHWRREQIGLAATKAALSIYALRGGAFMTFVGGEDGLEAELRRVHALRKHLPEIREGAADYDGVAADVDAIYCVLRHAGDRVAMLAVNTADAPIDALVTVTAAHARALTARPSVVDAWNGELIPRGSVSETGSVQFELMFAAHQARLLVLSDLPAAFPDLGEPTRT